MSNEKSFQELVDEAKIKFEKVHKVLSKAKISDNDIQSYIIIYLAAMREADKEGYDLLVFTSTRIKIKFIED